MKSLFIVFIFIAFSFLTLAGSNTKVIKPKNAASKTMIIIWGKARTYYPLNYNHSTIVSVKGPGTLKVLTRERIQSQNSLDYTVYYSINGEQKNKVNFNNIYRDKKASFKDSKLGFPGRAGIFSIELGRGENTIEFWRGNEKPLIDSRFLFTETKEKKIKWVSMSPLFPNEPVSLVTNEEVYTYYRYTETKPLRVKVTGPTTLRVLNRIENHYQMKGRIIYRIQVKEDKAVMNTYQLSSVRSDVTVYKKGCGKTPGKANEIVISVPGGTHLYQIRPLDKDKNSILARILFPKNDVKLKE
ncbi:MAG: hypothetical protein OQK52_02655 [Ignavibacteriaceae bacterium]|nr:hypothetical protein [Ignavibacteriaceae bacterium]MCW8822720.1 hypothetical protein [Ignavibacteriaceae bacterium]MCW8960985.1 hypothetical protein [Ignavibacteriaceae bacterium]